MTLNIGTGGAASEHDGSSTVISAHDLALGYGHGPVVEHLEFEVPRSSVLAVIGPNGSGKSTLLRGLAGLAEPMSGQLRSGSGSGGELTTAMVLQATEVDRSLPLSVLEMVRIARYPSIGLVGRMSPEDHRAVDEAIARVGLSELAHKQIHELSGGQRQRALVAQGLAQGAELLLLDEPFTGLDVVSKDRILRVIDSERDLGHTVVLSTHDLGDARRCDAVLVLAGHQVAFGPPEEVLRSEVLAGAFGGQLMRLDDGVVYLDDPHHHDCDPGEAAELGDRPRTVGSRADDYRPGS